MNLGFREFDQAAKKRDDFLNKGTALLKNKQRKNNKVSSELI